MTAGATRVPAIAVQEGMLRVAFANMRYGGIAGNGDTSGWHATVGALAAAKPHIVCLQEMRGLRPERTWRHLLRTANALGMTAILGPACPHSATGNHTALLVKTTAGLRLIDHGPPPEPVGTRTPWCYAELEVTDPQLRKALRIADPDLHLFAYSVHLNARSTTRQLEEAQTMASLIAERKQLALVAGDMNGYGRGGGSPLTEELERLPPHVQLVRCVRDSRRRLRPNFAVDDTFTRNASLIDVAAHMPAHRRTPQDLAEGFDWGRIDRLYAHPHLAAAARYWQFPTGGSDHPVGIAAFGVRR